MNSNCAVDVDKFSCFIRGLYRFGLSSFYNE